MMCPTYSISDTVPDMDLWAEVMIKGSPESPVHQENVKERDELTGINEQM